MTRMRMRTQWKKETDKYPRVEAREWDRNIDYSCQRRLCALIIKYPQFYYFFSSFLFSSFFSSLPASFILLLPYYFNLMFHSSCWRSLIREIGGEDQCTLCCEDSVKRMRVSQYSLANEKNKLVHVIIILFFYDKMLLQWNSGEFIPRKSDYCVKIHCVQWRNFLPMRNTDFSLFMLIHYYKYTERILYFKLERYF